jgi:mannose-6-phosphate isomerase
MDATALTPLRLAPIFKPAPWGGDRLQAWLGVSDPSPEPIGEAWVLSDQGEQLSRVVGGPFDGCTLRDLLVALPQPILGRRWPGAERFPLLLKFLDARQNLSVQVHPNDAQARAKHGHGLGKTEAWVIQNVEPTSRIYAGLRRGVGEPELLHALHTGTVPDCLHEIAPKPEDVVFLPAGTIHALGGGVTLFEVQQTSDLTYRLHDWGRVDAVTGQPRPLHIAEALACTDYSGGPCQPVQPAIERVGLATQERLIRCEQFTLWRWRADRPFTIGAAGVCRVVVGFSGWADLFYQGEKFALRPGEVLLLPAQVGACEVRPRGPVTVLECGLPGDVALPKVNRRAS